ncbi:CMRF35-like molecule 8, partial [Mustelus asterias]
MWILILVICSLPVSGALRAEEKVTGILGRSITINCHYDAEKFSNNMKYWCQGSGRGCSYLVRTDDPGGHRGRMSITDNNSQGIFVVTMENLQSSDERWYSCGIGKSGLDELFAVQLQIIDEPVPVLRFLSPPNASCSGGSVSISCESVQESLTILYKWYERSPSEDPKISDTNELDLHCQSFTQQQHQYYCTASNNQEEKSSE